MGRNEGAEHSAGCLMGSRGRRKRTLQAGPHLPRGYHLMPKLRMLNSHVSVVGDGMINPYTRILFLSFARGGDE
ncbi:hypothetical protein CEXT_230961 [Caerostris extrusa]|uniref:Uncharacterized protein n=1 Tax=Caerostris extrusa TaxID=172846 RepID=A0AAV4NEA3_CAEEX|nr:hypothetical protein CEXT_230961 [Caerostris extrusa]